MAYTTLVWGIVAHGRGVLSRSDFVTSHLAAVFDEYLQQNRRTGSGRGFSAYAHDRASRLLGASGCH